MKKILFTLIAGLTALVASAQDYKSIYQKYSDDDRVTAVYISPAMFKMIGKIPEIRIEESDVDLSPMIKSMTGFYMLQTEDTSLAEKISKDVVKIVGGNKFETLMEVKDKGQKINILSLGDDEFIKSLKHKVALRENDSQTRAESKQKILQARLDLLDALDQGMSVKDTIKEDYIQRVRAYEARQAYIEDLRDWALENPNAAEFRQGLEETNKKLGEKGIKKITLDDLGVEGLSDEDEASQSKERRK